MTSKLNNSNSWTIIPYRKKFLKFYSPLEIVTVYSDRVVSPKTVSKFSMKDGWKDYLDKFNAKEGIKVIHFFYEFSHMTLALDGIEVGNDVPLAIMIRYQKFKSISLEPKNKNIKLSLSDSISRSKYDSQFKMVYGNLELGNCYQLNLTNPFIFDVNGHESTFNLVSSLFNQERVGAYAHATYLEEEQRLLFSNSPECLFQMSKKLDGEFGYKIHSMPIKGTLPFNEHKDDKDEKDEFDKKWKELCASEKNQSELDMITDMIRNDLSAIEFPRARVLKRKKPLRVPGIIHQYSQVEVLLNQKPKLSKLISSLFPGASITGAPKKRVTELIKQIENSPRGFYCGSTFIGFKDFSCASINIRSFDASLVENKLVYSAGGGVTLQSLGCEEYEEMLLKVKSFSDLLK